MQGRSWMAALALVAGVTLALVVRPTPSRAGEKEAVVNKVTLQLRITGLGEKGGEVEVKPGHAGCEFKAVTEKAKKYDGSLWTVTVNAMDVKSTSPDRDCQFSITIREPGQPPRTVRRGIRLVAPTKPEAVPEQTFQVFLRSPSLAAKDDAERRLR
jgi:hypothetical protein